MKQVTTVLTFLLTLTGQVAFAGNPAGKNTDSFTRGLNISIENSDESTNETEELPSFTRFDTWYSTIENQDELENWMAYNSQLSPLHQTDIEHFWGDFYAAGMNLQAIENAGLKPVLPLMEQVSLVTSFSDLPVILGILHKIGIRPFFDLVPGDGFVSPSATLPAYATKLSAEKQKELISDLLYLTDENPAKIENMVKTIQKIDEFWLNEAISSDQGLETEREFGWTSYMKALAGNECRLAVRHAHQIQYGFSELQEKFTAG